MIPLLRTFLGFGAAGLLVGLEVGRLVGLDVGRVVGRVVDFEAGREVAPEPAGPDEGVGKGPAATSAANSDNAPTAKAEL